MSNPDENYDPIPIPDADINFLSDKFESKSEEQEPQLTEHNIDKMIQYAFREQLGQLKQRKKIATQLDATMEASIANLQDYINTNNKEIENSKNKQKLLSDINALLIQKNKLNEIKSKSEELIEKIKELKNDKEMADGLEELEQLINSLKVSRYKKDLDKIRTFIDQNLIDKTDKEIAASEQIIKISQSELDKFIPYQAYKKAELSIIEEKESALKAYMASINHEDRVILAIKALFGAASWSPILKNLIHPAIKVLSFENVIDPTTRHQVYHREKMYQIEKDIQDGLAERLQIMTDDHHLLDGIIIYNDPKHKEKPVMVMSQGNLTSYEMAYSTAQAYAKQFRCNVVLYNPRGVGHSLGRENTTNDAIKDCSAVIRHTLANFCSNDPAKLAIYGHSLGGGITAQAIKVMIKKRELPQNGIGLYINHFSFSSLHDFVVGFTGLHLGGLSKVFLKTFGHNTLNTAKALHDYTLAKSIVILTADHDALIKGQGKLSTKVQDINTITKLTFKSQYINHNEELIFTMKKKFASEYLDDKADLRTLNQYQAAVLSWVLENSSQEQIA